MDKTMDKSYLTICSQCLVAMLIAMLTVVSPAIASNHGSTHMMVADSTLIDRDRQEFGDMTMHMVQSAYPVNINQLGSTVCVKSNYNQVLPVYSESGTFYAAFRLNKGTNWLSGLPRGTYYINNRKITVS